VHLVVDRLPAKTAPVKAYAASTDGMLTPHSFPATPLNPDGLVWSHIKRTGVARVPLRRGKKLRDNIERQLATQAILPSTYCRLYLPTAWSK
jgi:hypothetical protein